MANVGSINGKLQSTALATDGVVYADSNGILQTTTVGSATQIMTSNGAGNPPTFQAIPATSGSLVLLSTQTASASSSISFTSFVSASYRYYQLQLDGVYLSGVVNLNMQVSSNNGSSYIGSGYNYGSAYIFYSGAGGDGGSSSASIALLGINLGSTAASSSNGYYNLYNLNNAANPFMYQGPLLTTDVSTPNYAVLRTYMGGYVTIATLNAFQITPASGTITAGTFRLYGVVA